MAEEAPSQPQSPAVPDPELSQYWCYHCEKRVSIETLTDLPDIICHECKNGFVEAIAAVVAAATASSPPPSVHNTGDEPSFSHQFLQVLRLIAQAARDDEAPPPAPPRPDPTSEPSDVDDFLRIELDGWGNDDDDDDNDIEFVNNDEDRSDDDDEIGDEEEDEGDRQRRDILRLRIRDLASRATSERHRVLDWSEILMGLEDNTIELRVEVPESDGFIGNPEDYVDAVGYQVLLQNLAESDGGGRRGAPPASKLAVEALQTVEITSEEQGLICAICKDSVPVGETAKKLPCGHGYHGDCIIPWLGSRNSCPVCRFELPTDDLEYEEDRRKRSASTTTGTSGTSHSGGNNPDSG